MPLETVNVPEVRGMIVKESKSGGTQHLTVESSGSTEAYGASVHGGRFRVGDSVILSGKSREEVGRPTGKPYYHAQDGWIYVELTESTVRKDLPAAVAASLSSLMSRLEALQTGTIESSRPELLETERMARELADAIGEAVPANVPIESVNHPLI
jgi:hypothetical protein